jgi:hypothetical protein
VESYVDVQHFDEIRLASMVATVGPIAVNIYAADDLQFYKGGKIFACTCNSRQSEGV